MLNRPNIESRFSARVLEAWAKANIPTDFTIKAAGNGQPAEILLHDEIGPFGVTSKQFSAALKQVGDAPLTLRINSPGGDVFDGISIFNALASRKAPVNIVVDGLAASAASVIAMAGSNIAMHESAMLMVHNAHCVAIGNRHDMTEVAATLEKVDGQLAKIYAARTGGTEEDMAVLMDNESWLTSTDAMETGFADSVIATPKKEQAKADAKLSIQAAYDPDGDGDDDIAEAVGQIAGAIEDLTGAIQTLTGTEEEPDDDDEVQNATDLGIEVRLRRLRLLDS